MADEEGLLAGGGVPIRAPRLEDAGLEDCALPPDAIAEAFSLAAAAVSSRLARLPLADSDDEDEGDEGRRAGCVDDAGPALEGPVPDADALVGGAAGGGGADEVVVVGAGSSAGDAVVVGGRGAEEDRVVVLGEGRGEEKLGKDEGCVDGIGQGSGERRRARGDAGDEKKMAEKEKGILVPDFA